MTTSGPAVVPRNGRKRIWNVRAVTQEDRNKGKELTTTWGRKDSTRRRVIADYELSGIDPNAPSSAEAKLGQMENSGLGPGTQETYLRYVFKRYPRATTDSRSMSRAYAMPTMNALTPRMSPKRP